MEGIVKWIPSTLLMILKYRVDSHLNLVPAD
jgi:hypothetical protein